MSYGRAIQIYNQRGWSVDSYGNGAAYTLRRTFDGESYSCFFQGDDAAEFRQRFDSCDEAGIDAIAFCFVDYAPIMDLDAMALD